MKFELTAQEIFDKALNGILTQKKIAFDKNRHKCVYFGKNGTKCAIGQLLPDSVASRWEIETDLIDNVDSLEEVTPKKSGRYKEVVRDLNDLGISLRKHRSLLTNLQYAHDSMPYYASWTEQKTVYLKTMKQIAEAYNLKMSV